MLSVEGSSGMEIMLSAAGEFELEIVVLGAALGGIMLWYWIPPCGGMMLEIGGCDCPLLS